MKRKRHETEYISRERRRRRRSTLLFSDTKVEGEKDIDK